MPPEHGTVYTILFAVSVCLVCSILVAGSAVLLRDRQQENLELFRQRNLLVAAALAQVDEDLSAEEVARRYGAIRPVVIERATGEVLDVDPDDPASDGSNLEPAPQNAAKVRELPQRAVIYQVREGESVIAIILPIHGKGVWSTIRGYLALEADGSTVRGIAFYEQGETPGLGGEVANPKWEATWVGKKVRDATGAPSFTVVKGSATNEHEVDGLSGATLTSRGVTAMVRFWIGENGYGPYLERLASPPRKED